jgi:hypothetical protein
MPGGIAMTEVDDPPLYRDLMRLKPDALTPNGWAVKAGVSRTVWSDMRRHDNPSRRTLEKLLAAAGSSLAEFEALRIGEEPCRALTRVGGLDDASGAQWRAVPLPPVALYEARIIRPWSGDGRINLIELDFERATAQVARPASLSADREAFAIAVPGSAMWPRFRPGRTIIVSPAATPGIGDDVLVRLLHSGVAKKSQVLIGELVCRTSAGLELRQFNPDLVFQIGAGSIAATDKVVGQLI